MKIHKEHTVTEVLAHISDTKTMQRFCDEIFTPSERSDIELRWKLISMLNEGFAQRDIASKLGISLCKITRGAKILKNKNSVCNQILTSWRGPHATYTNDP